MLRRPPFGSKVWDFEANDLWIYQRFLKVLSIFDIVSLEQYSVPYDDNHSCRFCCTKEERLRIEYVFRRMIGLDTKYLMDLDSYQNRCRLYQEEHYAIY